MGEVYDEFVQEMAELREQCAGRPDREMLRLWLLALEREQIVAVGYQERLIRLRLDHTPLPAAVRELIRHALVWAWKDEEMHAIFIRGALLRASGPLLRLRTYMQQWAGAMGGWVSSVRQNVRWREAPLSRAIATLVAWAGLATGKVSRAVRKQLRYHSFRDFCLFNVEAEQTAALAFRRLAEIASGDPARAAEVAMFRRMEDDEDRHARIFRAFVDRLAPSDELAPGESAGSLAEAIGAIGEVFLPRELRARMLEGNPLGAGGRVVVAQGEAAADKLARFRDTLERARLREILEERARASGKDVSALSVAIKPSFMLAYDRRDLSHVTDPELLAELARWLRELGVRDIAVIEAPNLYDRFYGNRTVAGVARYVGLEEGLYRVVDASDEQEPHSFVRGMGQYTISRTWRDADARISFSKMRSHPIEMVYLTVANVESMGGRCDEFLFAERQAHRDAALMTIMSDFPPCFALIDGYDLAADGLVGTMGCPRPRSPRRFYAGADAIAVDIVAARHLGVERPADFPILQAACYWFGDPTERITVEGEDTPIRAWRGPYATEISTLLSFLASPVYELGSGRGALFVADMDTAAFPPLEPEGLFLRAARRSLQALLGLRLRR